MGAYSVIVKIDCETDGSSAALNVKLRLQMCSLHIALVDKWPGAGQITHATTAHVVILHYAAVPVLRSSNSSMQMEMEEI